MKICNGCNRDLPLDEFWAAKRGKFGKAGTCKRCQSAKHKTWRLNNLARRADDVKRWRDGSGGAYIKSIRQWEERNKDKKKAHALVKAAKKSGRLVPAPCEACGAAKVEAHHDDYSRPLDVRWLCKKCHWRLHTEKAEELQITGGLYGALSSGTGI